MDRMWFCRILESALIRKQHRTPQSMRRQNSSAHTICQDVGHSWVTKTSEGKCFVTVLSRSRSSCARSEVRSARSRCPCLLKRKDYPIIVDFGKDCRFGSRTWNAMLFGILSQIISFTTFPSTIKRTRRSSLTSIDTPSGMCCHSGLVRSFQIPR